MAKYTFLTREQIDSLVPSEKAAYLNRLQTDEKFRTAYMLWYGSKATQIHNSERTENAYRHSVHWAERYGDFTNAETDMMIPLDKAISTRDAEIRKRLGRIKHNWEENHRLNTFTLMFSRVSTLIDYDEFDHKYGNGVKLKRGLDHYKSLIAKRDLQGVCDYVTELKNMRDYIVKTPQLRIQLQAELDNIDMIIKNAEEDRHNLAHVMMLEDEKKFLKGKEKDVRLKANYQKKMDEAMSKGGQIYIDGKLVDVEPPLPTDRKSRRAFKKANKGKEWPLQSYARLQQKNEELNATAGKASLGILLASIGGAAALALLTPLAPIVIAGIGAAVTVVGSIASQIIKRIAQKRNEKKFAKQWEPVKSRADTSLNKSVTEDEYKTEWMEKNSKRFAHIKDNAERQRAIQEAYDKDHAKFFGERVLDTPARNPEKFAAFKAALINDPELLAQFIPHDTSNKAAHAELIADIKKHPEAYALYLPESDDTMTPEMALAYRDFAQKKTREQAVAEVDATNSEEPIKGDPRAAFDKAAQDPSKTNPAALKTPRYRKPHRTPGCSIKHDSVESVQRSCKEIADEDGRGKKEGKDVVITTEFQAGKAAAPQEAAPQEEAPEEKGPEQTTPETNLGVEDLVGEEADAAKKQADAEREAAKAAREKAEQEEAEKAEGKENAKGEKTEEGKGEEAGKEETAH